MVRPTGCTTIVGVWLLMIVSVAGALVMLPNPLTTTSYIAASDCVTFERFKLDDVAPDVLPTLVRFAPFFRH